MTVPAAVAVADAGVARMTVPAAVGWRWAGFPDRWGSAGDDRV
jgi:hypothetical protein